MIEVLWHGRGGQGAFTAARLLGAAAALADGLYALAFPSFGPERRGAPMRAFTKISHDPIGNRSEIAKADFAVYLDATLFGADFAAELKDDGVALVNTPVPIDDPRVISIDASDLSQRILKRDIPNTAFVAALGMLVPGIGLDNVEAAVRANMPARLHEPNIAVVREMASQLSSGKLVYSAGETAEDGLVPCQGSLDVEDDSQPSWHTRCLADASSLDPSVYARTTCWQAGHLVTRNAGWRTSRPVVDADKCIGCWSCYMLCPDGTLQKAPGRKVVVDYDFCKGCGICAKACPKGAITMAAEKGM